MVQACAQALEVLMRATSALELNAAMENASGYSLTAALRSNAEVRHVVLRGVLGCDWHRE